MPCFYFELYYLLFTHRVGFDKKAALTSPSYEEDVILSCLKILYDVCQCVLSNCPEVKPLIIHVLPFLLSKLIVDLRFITFRVYSDSD